MLWFHLYPSPSRIDMNMIRCGFRKLALALAAAILLPSLSASAATIWTNTASSGLWRISTNWSPATAPNSNSDPTQITNAVTKTVTIDSLTASTNLSIRGLTLSAPAGSTNTLALVNVPLGTPLTTSKAFLVGNRSVLAITNSAVSATDNFDITNGSMILDSGSLNCAVNCDLQSGSTVVNGGTLTATTGTTGIRMGRFNGAVSSLTLNGGTVTTLRVTLGSNTGTSNTLTLAGGNLICNDSMILAQLQNTTGNATMTAGNLIVTNGITLIADRGNGTFSQSGGSVSFAAVRIGDVGVGTYNLTAAGQFTTTPRTTNDLTIIGNHGDGTFNQSGGIVVIRNEIHVSDFPGDATVIPPDPPSVGNLNITGGQFFATNDIVAIGRYGIGTMTVSNSTVVLTNTSVGRHDTGDGTLTIQNNGKVFILADLSVARLPLSTGHAFVNGGLLSVTNDDLWVGRGGNGDLTISSGIVTTKSLHVGESDDRTNSPSGTLTISGGTTAVSSNLVLGTASLCTGNATVNGGKLFVTNLTGSARFVVNQGAFTINQGEITTDQVLVSTNGAVLVFNGGTLRARSLSVSNGAPFTVGDGVQPAVLEMVGGLFNFPNGLVIAPNASVIGCGTVIGPITNNGIYSNTCGGATPLPTTISAVGKSANLVTLSCASQNGSSYTLEYKIVLTDPAWTPILPATPGTGSLLNLTDPTATNSSRFYRVRVQ